MRVFRKVQVGFTLTEMMVVFSIIATLTLLSATALQSANKDNLVDEATQQILNGIREAQNRAVGVSVGTGSTDVKAWGIELNGSGYSLNHYDKPIAQNYLVKNLFKNTAFSNNITVTARPSSGSNSLPFYLAYSVPFGRSYMSFGDSCTCDTVTCQSSPTLNPICNWGISSRYERDWKIASGSNYIISMEKNLTSSAIITVTYKGTSIERIINIKASGDAYVQ